MRRGFLLVVVPRGIRNSQAVAERHAVKPALAAFMGCIGLLIHGFVDFNLQIPANAAFFFALSALATNGANSPSWSRGWQDARVAGMDAGRLLEKSSELARHDSLRLASLQEIYGVPAREQSLSDYWRILQKRKWTVIVSVVVVFIMAGLITIRTTPIYDAVTRIMISPRTSNPLNFKDS